MKLLKKINRSIVFPTMMGFKADKIIRSFAPNNTLNIMYHGVVKNDSCYFSPRHITETQFEKQLIYLKNNFNIIRLNQSELNTSIIDPSKKTITISFDDGFKNNLDCALPLIEKHKIPVTFFISSICIEEMEHRFLWSELIAGLNYFYKNQVIVVGGIEYKNLVDSENKNLTDRIKKLQPTERDQLLAEIENKYDLVSKIQNLPSEVWKLLTKQELIQLAKSPMVDIGSHGHLHYNLGDISIEDAKIELEVSKKKLEETIGKEINMIAYPDGSYSEEVKDLAEKIGYKFQLSVNYLSDKDKSDPRIQNRHGVASTTTFESNMLILNLAFRKKGI